MHKDDINMPCKDTTSQVILKMDHQDQIIDFSYTKHTCRKTIGDSSKFLSQLPERNIFKILNMTFNEFLTTLPHRSNKEETTLLFLQWEALQAIIGVYLGQGPKKPVKSEHAKGSEESKESKESKKPEIDRNRYVISSVEHEPTHIKIVMMITPPKVKHKIQPCFNMS